MPLNKRMLFLVSVALVMIGLTGLVTNYSNSSGYVYQVVPTSTTQYAPLGSDAGRSVEYATSQSMYYYLYSTTSGGNLNISSTPISTCFSEMQTLCPNSLTTTILAGTSWSQKSYSMTQAYGVSGNTIVVAATASSSAVSLVPLTLSGSSVSAGSTVTCTTTYTNEGNLTTTVVANETVYIGVSEVNVGTQYVQVFVYNGSTCTSDYLSSEFFATSALVEQSSGGTSVIIVFPTGSTSGTIQFIRGSTTTVTSASYSYGHLSCTYDGFNATYGIACGVYNDGTGYFDILHYDTTTPAIVTKSSVIGITVTEPSFHMSFTIGTNGVYFMAWTNGNELASDYATADGGAWATFTLDSTMSNTGTGISCVDRAVITSGSIPNSACEVFEGSATSWSIYADYITVPAVIFTATTTQTIPFTTTTTISTTTTVTQSVSGNAPNPATAGYWLVVFVFLVIPVGLFDGVLAVMAGDNGVSGSALTFMTTLGLLVGSIFGLLAGIVPLPLVGLFAFVFALVVIFGRG